MSEKTIVGGIPIECLTGEPAAIWSGWRALGDRELVREASAKGTHISLAHRCLAFRRNWSLEEAQQYFFKEVEFWISELLDKHQVFRASHILKNVGKTPVEYIFDVCKKCKVPSLRNYLSEYLIDANQFDHEYIQAFHILKCINQFEQKYMIKDGLGCSICIEDVIKLPENIKQALCTELYFSVPGEGISKKISNTILWDYLLSNNKIDLIQYWIDSYYNDNGTVESLSISENYKSLFNTLDISPDMLETIDSSNASTLVKDLTKNHLCRYGIFVRKEQQDLKLLLSRIFACRLTLKEFNTILSYKWCSINKTEFLQDIDKKLCLAYSLDETDSAENKAKCLDLNEVLTKMCNCQEQFDDPLIEGIFKTIHYISEDPNEFLQQNYLIVLELIFVHLFKKNDVPLAQDNSVTINTSKLKDIFNSGSDLNLGSYNISNDILQTTLSQIPILQQIVGNTPKPKEVTMYDLLDGYKNLNVKELFKWRFKNEPMPHFSNETLVKKYGYKETLTYGYYLKEARPNMAIHSLKHDQGNIVHGISSRRKSKTGLYAHILALKNLDKPEIICSCISFIEMLGIESENLRLHVTAANYVQKEMNIPIGNLLEGVMFRNENDLRTVMSYLESSYQKYLNDNLVGDSEQFVNVLRKWDIIVRFAKAHNTTLPESLLKFLASRNHWFEFVLTCHIFSYPINQVLENAKHFEDTVMREHLLTCLNNIYLTKSHSPIHSEQKLKYRDVRQSLYSKIGLKQSVSPTSGSPVSTDASSSDSYISTFEYAPTNESVCTPEDDLWLAILKCHQSPDPPGALINASRLTSRPILTILATCYEPSSTAAYCYSWMVISVSDENILTDYKECLDQQIWSADKVFNLLDRMVLSGYINTLSKAYKIFMPDSCLTPFFECLAQCINIGDFKESEENLLDFKTQCLTLKCNKVMDWNCSDSTYSNNLYWIAVVAVRCVITTLAHCLRSSHLQMRLLAILMKCKFHVDLPVHVPDFQCLLQVTKILQNTDIMFDFTAFTLSDNVYNYDAEIQRCIDHLLIQENYNSALELANVTGLNSSEIILAQCRNKCKQRIQKNGKVEYKYWNECALNFEKYNVPGEKAAEFFVEHAEKVDSHKERYEILKLAFEMLKNVETEQQTIDTLEMAMWKSCILAGPSNILLDGSPHVFNKLKTELLSGLNKIQVTCTLTDPNERNATEILINKLIDTEKLDLALRISTIFNYKHKDLQILMLCLSLAEGEILPNDLTAEQKSFFSETSKTKQQKYNILKNRGLQRFSSSSSLNVSTLSPNSIGETSRSKDENTHKVQKECLLTLEKLFDVLQHGVDICLRVVLCYKLAVRLGKSYEVLLMLNNPLQFLQEITDSNIPHQFDVAVDIITAYKISSDSTARFLAENITSNITRAIENGCEDYVTLWGYPLNTSFHFIMEVCSDVSLLGCQLLKVVNKLLGPSCTDRNVSTLKTIVELLIRSHDCFTAACNMEGIASVLRKCQNVANTLQSLKYWTLLVRLVTGVGRFTEMNYVFQIIKENHQFEFLLGQGLDKVVGLKTALLEFLKCHCPEDKEAFKIVAVHFRLYHEIALMWETEAKDVIKKLISDAAKDHERSQSGVQHEIKLTKTDSVQKQLQLASTNYTYATENYLKDDKLNLASRCSDQAQLVALQLSLLGTVSNNQQVVCILNLKNVEVDKILCHTLNFSQALVVIHAYNHHVDWANLIYTHCILNGEMKYLKDFTVMNNLTPSLVQDCARRYRLEKSINHTMTDNMKTLISELSDIECKYMLASQLGFKNIVETMLNNPMIGAYLKDTVWRKGYSAG